MQKMLIVDDEDSICFSMSEYFSMQSFHVDCARVEEEARALLDESDYSVVIGDLCLGDPTNREGLDVIEHVRQRHPSTRIIVLTAFGTSEMEAEARRRGADAFLHKPKPLSEVAQVVYGLVGTTDNRLCPDVHNPHIPLKS